ncbi:DMT family transporter [Nonomuraea zeae]|uniref:DMT family transporter n=1 Tax=Nonomuraea zeae TaxID=1642303 RepID=A0A5S4FF98_9ACTN|nr:DMT family transporter [Nonomuraea zeae]TMR17729.1 hypothetical protein ETD85_54085 [Nonomuraea zeae]
MSDLIGLIVLSVLSSIAYAVAAVVQERYAEVRRGVRRWAVPLLLNGAGAGLHVAALPFGAVGVVQALGALTLVFALPIAAARRRGRVARAAWGQAWLTVAALAGLLILTAPGTGALSASAALWLAGGVVAVIGTLALTARHVGAPLARSLLLSAAAGIAFGAASVLTKALLADAPDRVLTGRWLLTGGIVAGLSLAGQILSQRSYRGAGLAAPLAMVSVVNPVLACAIGWWLLGDGVRFGAAGAVLAVVFAFATVRGVVGLAAQSHPAGASAAAATPACPAEASRTS